VPRSSNPTLFDLLPYSDEDALFAAGPLGPLDKAITHAVGACSTEGCPEFTVASKANDLSTREGGGRGGTGGQVTKKRSNEVKKGGILNGIMNVFRRVSRSPPPSSLQKGTGEKEEGVDTHRMGVGQENVGDCIGGEKKGGGEGREDGRITGKKEGGGGGVGNGGGEGGGGGGGGEEMKIASSRMARGVASRGSPPELSQTHLDDLDGSQE